MLAQIFFGSNTTFEGKSFFISNCVVTVEVGRWENDHPFEDLFEGKLFIGDIPIAMCRNNMTKSSEVVKWAEVRCPEEYKAIKAIADLDACPSALLWRVD